MKNYSKIIFAGLALLGLNACESKDQEFPDFETQTVYFAKQYPVRTLELGSDDYVDLTDDNAHRINIKATMGGAYDNRNDIVCNIQVDPTLCAGIKYADNDADVVAMPESHYKLAANTITIPKGEISAGVSVELTDAFFADPLSVSRNYVIPLKMTSATGVDSILSAKNFVLYAVKYINPYTGVYVKQKDEKEEGSIDEDYTVTTIDLNTSNLVYGLKDADGNANNCNLKLDFKTGSITTDDADFTISNGTVRFVEKDENQMIGHKHPNTIYLNFSIANATLGLSESVNMAINLKYRGVIPEFFEVKE